MAENIKQNIKSCRHQVKSLKIMKRLFKSYRQRWALAAINLQCNADIDIIVRSYAFSLIRPHTQRANCLYLKFSHKFQDNRFVVVHGGMHSVWRKTPFFPPHSIPSGETMRSLDSIVMAERLVYAASSVLYKNNNIIRFIQMELYTNPKYIELHCVSNFQFYHARDTRSLWLWNSHCGWKDLRSIP